MILEAELDRANATTAIFRLTGRMTLGMRLREVESRITEVAGNGVRKLILELSGVEFLDSAGLGLLMILYGKMKTNNGELRLVAPHLTRPRGPQDNLHRRHPSHRPGSRPALAA